jgi:hypothetical protein
VQSAKLIPAVEKNNVMSGGGAGYGVLDRMTQPKAAQGTSSVNAQISEEQFKANAVAARGCDDFTTVLYEAFHMLYRDEEVYGKA